MKALRECLLEASAAAGAGRRDDAIAAYREAVALAPERGDLHYNLAVLLFDAGDLDAAGQVLQSVAALRPGWAAAPLAQGRISYRQQRHADAQRHFERAVALAPDSVEALGNLALAHGAQKRFDLALPHLERARALAPADEAIWHALRECLVALGRDDDARADLHAFELQAALSARLVATSFVSATLAGDEARIAKYLALALDWRYEPRDAPLVAGMMARLQYLDVPRATILAFYRIYNRLQQASRGDRPPLAPLPRVPAGRLRVGYLSADFRDHVMGRLLLDAFVGHDRSRVELFGYSLMSPGNEDAMTLRFRAAMDAYADLAALDDAGAAQRIADDGLDVLVDLMAHSTYSRPSILLHKPAPVIVTHLGYHGCVGLEQVDFKLTDRHCDLPDAAAWQIEAPLVMDTCVLPVRRVTPAAGIITRAECGIADDATVFGVFVGAVKLSARCLALWRVILDCIPGSLLAFSPYLDAERPLLLRRLADAGIGAERVVFLPSTWDEARDRMRYQVVDVALDTMPYTGGDTTVAALDMGVPVVTRRGERHAERMSYSILAHLGVTATVAASDDEYVAIACRLGTDRAWRAEVSARIRAQFSSMPLPDPRHYTRCLEQALFTAVAQKAGIAS